MALTNDEAREILQKEYHVDNFEYLLDDCLLADYKKEKHDVLLTEGNAKVFSSVYELGSSHKCDVVVFEVYLTEEFKNRRVKITQEMFKVLRSLRIDNALVAFVNPDGKNYRFSLLTSKYEYDGDTIKKVLSNPRRLSFSLGYNTKTKTAYDFLISKGKVDSLEELTSRFSVEVVNKEFYNQIAISFTKLVGGERFGKKYDRLLRIQSSVDNNKYSEFAVRLIGRIMFCWFLKEKKSEAGIALIPEEWLSIEKINSGTSYYHQVLEPLFFEMLNTPQRTRKDCFVEDESCRQVPYLNGGLFAPHHDDFYKFDIVTMSGRYGLIDIPDSWFIDFYQVLSEYNFTVDENTTYDIELSVDPEMLGRIFENLLAEINPDTGENAKKSTGSFYTPRDIVDYMVDSSLQEYLKNKTGIEENRLRELIKYNKLNEELAVFSIQEKKSIINALYDITILDPACGSGAFPIGMLQKIVFILEEIDEDANLWFDKATENVTYYLRKEFEKRLQSGSLDYIRKLCVIQNSIFGVDIQPSAVEISRLRCFLSLVIEEKVNDIESDRGIKALPNLDFKIICANSLLPLSDEGKGSIFENPEHIKQLKDIRERYFDADPNEKNQLKYEFSQVQGEMKEYIYDMKAILASKRYESLFRWKPFDNDSTDWFDPEWMFGVKDGFDIVIGNPPYVSVKAISENDKNTYRKHYRSAKGRFNLFTLMIEKGKSLLKRQGILSFIQPEGLFTNVEYRHIRKILVNEGCIRNIVLFDKRVFEASVDTAIMLYVNEESKDDDKIVIYKNLFDKSGELSVNDIKKSEDSFIQVSLNEENISIINKMDRVLSTPLVEYLEIQQGIIYSGRPKEEVFSNDCKNELYKKCLDGRDVGKWYINWDIKKENKYIEYTRKLHRPREERLFIANEKILIPRKSTKIVCGYDNEQYYALNTAYVCVPKLVNKVSIKYLIGLLNSKLMNYYYQNKYLGWQITIPALNQLPIVTNTDRIIDVEKIVESILTNKKEDIVQKEKEIDSIVYEIYGLTPEEIVTVEAAIK